MIQENHGRPVRVGETIGAAYVLGYFDSVEDMEAVYARYAGARHLRIDKDGFEAVQEIPGGAGS